MSISTASISSRFCCSGSSDVLQKNEDAKEAWRHEIAGRINVLDDDSDTIEDYLTTYVPSIVPYQPPTVKNAKTSAFAKWSPKKGEERQSYPELIRGLRSLVTGFPKNKQLTFLDTSQNMIPFPYAAFTTNHHGSKPDISVSFPGKPLRVGDWQQIAMVMEAKSSSDQDPFPRQGTTHADTIIQLAVSARNLMVAHGLLAVFILGIYGDDVRIARFDHSCVVVSKPFSLRQNNHLLRQFFWRFSHPVNAKIPFVGWDPTICKLSPALLRTLKKRLGDAGVEVPADISKARRALVYESETSTRCKAYILFKLLDVNSRLFSRATMVWVAVEDNADLYNSKVPLTRVIVKESWRQIIRTSEKEFYQRLNKIPDNLRIGLPRLLYGGDLGERAVAQWKAEGGCIHYDDDDNVSGAAGGLKDAPSSSPPSSSSSSSRSSTFSAFLGSSLSSLSDDSVSDVPLAFPEQQTFTWRSSRGQDKDYRERSHMRFVIDIVGRPLTDFRSTQELVTAMRDAIIGHKLACEHAEVLHRDISVGNILIVENRYEHPFAGFIHDFDYSSMLDPDGQQDSEMFDAEQASSPECSGSTTSASGSVSPGDKDQKPKERTGTFYFMAIQLLGNEATIHDISHDLESFYWVLLWVILRHTQHEHPDGARACSTYFKYDSDEGAATAKRGWLMRKTGVRIKGNRPLTRLLMDLRTLINGNLDTSFWKRVPLTHDAMLAVFNKALERNDWPENDAAIPFKLPNPVVQSVVEVRVKASRNVEPEPEPEDEEGRADDSDSSEGTPSPEGSAGTQGSSKRRRGNDDDGLEAPKPKKRSKPAQTPTRRAPPRKAKEKAALARAARLGGSNEDKPAPARQAKRRTAMPAKATEVPAKPKPKPRRKG